jgi:hypothetical protein
MKRIVFAFLLIFGFSHLIIADDKDLVGSWWGFTKFDSLQFRFFTSDGSSIRYSLDTMFFENKPRLQSISSVKPGKYQIKDIDIIEIDGEKYRFRVSPTVLIINDSFYFPMVSQKLENLIGTWKITGDSFDTEMKIDEKTIQVTKGKQSFSYTYISNGFPDIAIINAENKKQNSYYFFYGKNTLFIALPDDKSLIFQRVIE